MPSYYPTRNVNQPSLSDLIAEHGHSSSTDWLDPRYHHWYLPYRPSGSSFTPVQGYMVQGSYIFAWGNPIVLSSVLYPSFIDHFSAFVDSQNKKLVWFCVSQEFQEILGKKLGWSTVSCIKEDLIDPTHVLHMMSKKDCGRIKNLRNSLSKAWSSGLLVEEVQKEYLVNPNRRVCIDKGITGWKENRTGMQIASTTVNPWLDIEHRRYWLARLDSAVVGILILSPIHHGQWEIVNVVPFTSSPKGTSEALIYTVLKDIEAEQSSLDESTGSLVSEIFSEIDQLGTNMTKHSDSTNDGACPHPNFTLGDTITTPGLVSFGISATQDVVPRHNPSSKLELLIGIYNKVAYLGGLFGRNEFRSKFDPKHNTMYVCYPPDVFDKGSRFSFFEDLINALRK